MNVRQNLKQAADALAEQEDQRMTLAWAYRTAARPGFHPTQRKGVLDMAPPPSRGRPARSRQSPSRH